MRKMLHSNRPIWTDENGNVEIESAMWVDDEEAEYRDGANQEDGHDPMENNPDVGGAE